MFMENERHSKKPTQAKPPQLFRGEKHDVDETIENRKKIGV